MKIGVIVGRETAFPDAFIEWINSRYGPEIRAEMVRIGATRMDEPVAYRVIVDRISHEVPFYRQYLGKAVAEGAVVINNPYWWSADDKFLECVLAGKLGVAVPKSVLVPNRTYEADIIDESLRNLIQPPDWEQMVDYTGLPAVLKPSVGGGSKNINVVHSIEELRSAWEASGYLQMVLQEFIKHDQYVRCFAIGREHVRVARFNISLPRHERYDLDHALAPQLYEKVVDDCRTLTRALGYDMDTLEFAIRDGIPYAIDFLNPAPDCEPNSVTQENFDWMIEHVANLAVRYARDSSARTARPAWQSMIGGRSTPGVIG